MPDVNVWAEDPALGAITNDVTIEQQIVTATAGQTVFPLTEFTVTDAAALAVHVNGIKEYRGAGYGWTLTAPTEVTLTTGATVGDLVVFTLNTITADPTLNIAASDVAATVADQGDINLQNHLDAMDTNTIAELRTLTGTTHGALARIVGTQAVGDTFPQLYRWDAASTATDDDIAIIQPTATAGAGRWVALTPPFVDLLDDIFSTIYPIASRLIFLGGTTINDGNGGIYYWNSATVRSAANGTVIVDPSVSKANQGTGSGVGCYIRVTQF